MNSILLDKIKEGHCRNGVQLPPDFEMEMICHKGSHSEMHYFKYDGYNFFHNVGKPSTILDSNNQESDIFFEFNGYLFTKTVDYCYVCGFDGYTTMIWILKYGDLLPKTLDNFKRV